MQLKEAEILKKLLPEHFHPYAFVAGGYAFDPSLASDIDLWVVNQGDMVDAEATIRTHLMAKGFLVDGAPLNRGGDMLTVDYDEHPHKFKVSAILSAGATGLDKEVQVLVTAQPSITALLDHFDITTHKVAWSLEGDVTIGAANFAQLTVPRVTRWDTPSATWERLEKIAKRYGFEPHPDDVEKLELLIADPEEWKEVA